MSDTQLIEHLDTLVQKICNKQFVLPLPHRQILLILAQHKTANLSQLAKIRGVRKSSMSVMLSQLVEQQLVIKANSKSDKRQNFYLISRNGSEQLSEDLKQYNQWLDSALGQFDSREQQLLTRLFARFNEVSFG